MKVQENYSIIVYCKYTDEGEKNMIILSKCIKLTNNDIAELSKSNELIITNLATADGTDDVNAHIEKLNLEIIK